MAQDSQLPALISETLPELKTFDGWDTDDLLAWLQQATVTLIAAEKWTDAHRLNVGAGLYMLREQLGDGAYGRTEEELADQIKVSTRTLHRWRALYEKTRKLPPPGPSAKRAAGQKRRHAAKLRHGVQTLGEGTEPIIDTTAEQVPNAHLSGLEPDEPTGKTAPPAVAPDAPAVQPSAKDENEAVMGHVRGLLRSDVAVLSRAVKRTVLADLEGLVKRAQQANADDGSRVVLLAPDLVARLAVAPSEPFDAGVNRVIRDLLAKIDRTSEAAPVLPAPTPPAATKAKGKSKKAPPKVPSVACAHPFTRRIGTGCGVCGVSVIGK